MHALVTGGTGFVGTRLVRALLDRGDEVTLLVRPETDKSRIDPRAKTTHEVIGADAVVNLAGAAVLDERWTPARLKVLRDSRVLTTERVAPAAARVLVSASAIGYYGMRSDDVELDESSPPGDDVLARLCVEWERAALERAKARVAVARIGIVLGAEGAMARLVPMYRRFMGGPIGSGKQWWSWIHVDDVVRALIALLDDPKLEGPVNLTSDEPETMEVVSRTLASVLHRPNALRVPAFALRAVLGDGAEVLLTGQRVRPRKLVSTGFRFEHPHLEGAIRAALK